MNRVAEIDKRAFIARVNEHARVVVVDMYYRTIGEPLNKTELVLVYDDGTERVFRGFDRAA